MSTRLSEAIEAEYDAVKNVVEKNIDTSFKTFSG